MSIFLKNYLVKSKKFTAIIADYNPNDAWEQFIKLFDETPDCIELLNILSAPGLVKFIT